jgi:hypothetical protein
MATWADTAEFRQFLVASGLHAFSNVTEAQEALDLQGALDAAVEEWNAETRYWPFLSTGVAEERSFRPRPGRVIDLNGGLLSITSLKTGVTFANPTGVTRVLTQDYVLAPEEAPSETKPWTSIQVGFNQGADWSPGTPGSIRINGIWGYTLTANLKQDARRAVMAMAARSLAPQIRLQQSKGGLKRHRQGDSEKEWGGVADAEQVWGSMIDRAVARYRRLRVA